MIDSLVNLVELLLHYYGEAMYVHLRKRVKTVSFMLAAIFYKLLSLMHALLYVEYNVFHCLV